MARWLVGVVATLLLVGCQTPPQNHLVEVGDSTIYVEEAGEGPAVVLIHGGQTDRRMWDREFEWLARDHRVIRYDVRGFGRSGEVVDSYASHEDLARLMDALQVRRATIVGLSLGGRIAVDFALSHADRVDRLILVAPGLTGWNWSGEDHAFFTDIAAAGARGDTEKAVELWLACPYMAPAMENPVVAEHLRVLAHDNQRAWTMPPVEMRLEPPATERLNELVGPVLLLLGTRDVPDILKIADRLEAEVESLQRHDYEDIGHMLNLEAPDRFEADVRAFLQDTR